MSVNIKLSAVLRKATNWQETIEVTGDTPLECLQSLEAQFPSIKQWIYGKDGKVLPQIQFFVNGERIYADELTKRLNSGDELLILLAIAGG
jgi:molybdopterin converting factor small subunit